MIRDNNKIFGEKNDPNTVVATETLKSGYPIVGAGNKGVKTIDLGTKKILYTGADSQLKGFNYNTANKVIGTDSSGNLVLKDMPTGKNVIDILVSAASSSGGYVTTNVYNQPYTSVSSAEAARNMLNGAGDISIVKLVKSADSTTYPTITLTLKTPLVLTTTKNVKVILTIEPDALYSGGTCPSPWIYGPIKLGSVQLVQQSLGGAINYPGQNTVINTTMSFAAGTYNQITIQSVQVIKGDSYLRVAGCLIY